EPLSWYDRDIPQLKTLDSVSRIGQPLRSIHLTTFGRAAMRRNTLYFHNCGSLYRNPGHWIPFAE
ncbi:MAG: hypothetical protein ABSH41_08760, partial [Syntrophobacteraceae bacterium]